MDLICPINDLSYGIVSRYILTELSKIVEVGLFPIGRLDYTEEIPQESQIIAAAKKYAENNFSTVSLRIFHQFDLALHSGQTRIGFPIFELDTFTPREIHHLKSQDIIYTPTEWGRNILRAHNIPARVVPFGVDRTIFYDEPLQDGPTIFLNVGKWEKRKGHDFLAEAFNKAFTKKDDVRLYMVPHNYFLSQTEVKEWTDLYTKSDLADKIKIFGRLPSMSHVAQLMRMSTCGIFPSRAEGWNLPLMEMMSVGRQVIATDYSAHTEYCRGKNSFLIPGKMGPAHDGKWFFGHGNWLNPDIDYLVDVMRHVHKNREFNAAGVETAKSYTWEQTAIKTIFTGIPMGSPYGLMKKDGEEYS